MGVPKFYLTADAAPFTPANFRGTWDDTAGAVTRRIDSDKAGGGAVASVARAEAVLTNPYRVCLYRGVSGPLAAQTFSPDTLDLLVGVTESNAAADFHWRLHAYVTVGDTDSVRGTLLSDYEEALGVNEWGTSSATAGKALSAGQATSLVNVSAGDRLVVEIGYTSRNAVTTSRTGTLWYGTQDATTLDALGDLSLNGGATAGAGYVSFAVGPTEGAFGGRVTQAVSEVPVSSSARRFRATQVAVEVVRPLAQKGRVTQSVLEVLYPSDSPPVAGAAGGVPCPHWWSLYGSLADL